MICPICYFQDTKVIDSRVASDGLSIRRRRECEKCGFRFSTLEEIEILDLSVIKRNGETEEYSRDKLAAGLRRAFEKRPISDDDFKKMIHNIERDIQKLRKNEVKSSEIGESVMNHLKEADLIAYIRFASVYNSFDNVNDFTEMLDKIVKEKKNRK
jgi:transcriptional repressor NrdR